MRRTVLLVVMAAAPDRRGSLASASNNTARQIGAAFGVAALGAAAGDPGSSGFVTGFHRAAIIAAIAWFAAALIAAATAGRRSPGSLRRWQDRKARWRVWRVVVARKP